MIRTAVLSACAIASIAGSAQAGTVSFRIVERRTQTSFNPNLPSSVTNDNVLNFAVLARVTGLGESLGNFAFDITSNDAQAAGTFNRSRISIAGSPNYDNTATQYSNNSTVGVGGIAASYAYLANINPFFNGLINQTGGSFTDNPAVNEIGLVAGSPTGSFLLLSTDQTGDGNPDTYAGNDTGIPPNNGDTAALDPALAAQFFASNTEIEVYRFNYNIISTATRALTFSVSNAQAQTFINLGFANGVWGPNNPQNATAVTTAGATVAIVPAPGAAALLGLGGLVAARRRRN